ncbi:hypothetical protein SPHV1_320112 [Novosphingobium sp. KN65.2]|nr:hypothetical protein SPHV1_320112 [Novosphingobium sp. KN65.2]
MLQGAKSSGTVRFQNYIIIMTNADRVEAFLPIIIVIYQYFNVTNPARCRGGSVRPSR